MDVMVKTIKFTREQYMILGKFHDELDLIMMKLRKEELTTSGEEAIERLQLQQKKMFDVLSNGIESKSV